MLPFRSNLRFQLLNYVALSTYSVHCFFRPALPKSILYHFNFAAINPNLVPNANQLHHVGADDHYNRTSIFVSVMTVDDLKSLSIDNNMPQDER